MKKARSLRKIVASAAFAVAAVAAGMGSASAGWVQIPDDPGDATNPGYPSNEGPGTVGAYLQDLLDLPGAPTLITVGDNYGGAPLSGLGNPVSGNTLLLSILCYLAVDQLGLQSLVVTAPEILLLAVALDLLLGKWRGMRLLELLRFSRAAGRPAEPAAPGAS